MMTMILQDKYDTCIAEPICYNIDFIGAPGLSKTIYFDLIVFRFTQVNYGVSILRMQYIDFVLLIMIVTVFCIIFLDGPVLVYLKLKATSIHLMLFYAKPHSLLPNIAKALPTI